MGKCITATCNAQEAPALKRGLCMLCYSRAKKLVSKGDTTWNEIVSLGLALPTDEEDPFMKGFIAAKSKDTQLDKPAEYEARE